MENNVHWSGLFLKILSLNLKKKNWKKTNFRDIFPFPMSKIQNLAMKPAETFYFHRNKHTCPISKFNQLWYIHMIHTTIWVIAQSHRCYFLTYSQSCKFMLPPFCLLSPVLCVSLSRVPLSNNKKKLFVHTWEASMYTARN